MALWQFWWLWMLAGLGLAMAEMLLPGFVFLGFALGALATGGLIWAGLVGTGLAPILVVFAVISGLCWLGLRRAMGVRPGQRKGWQRDINENERP